MKTKAIHVWGVILAALLVLILITEIAPDESAGPPAVTRESTVTYSIGEKVEANPYGDWLDGQVLAITSEDNYIVRYCGAIGWFNKWECKQDSLLRSQLAKTNDR